MKWFSGELERKVGDGMRKFFWLDRWQPKGSLPSSIRHFKSKGEYGRGGLKFDGFDAKVVFYLA